jgi:hypothetical protein
MSRRICYLSLRKPRAEISAPLNDLRCEEGPLLQLLSRDMFFQRVFGVIAVTEIHLPQSGCMCELRRSCRRVIYGIVADLDYKGDWAVSPGDQAEDGLNLLPSLYPYSGQALHSAALSV